MYHPSIGPFRCMRDVVRYMKKDGWQAVYTETQLHEFLYFQRGDSYPYELAGIDRIDFPEKR